MAQETAKAVEADVSVSDVFVAVDVGSESRARIVGVEQVNVRKAEQFTGGADHFAQSGRGRNVETGGVQMAGVEAEAYGDVGKIRSELAQRLQLFEARAEVRAGARGIFEKNREAARGETVRGVAEAENESRDTFFHGLVPIAAGVHYEIFGVDRDRTLDFTPETGDGFGADFGVERREVDQVVDVDGERAKIVPLAHGAQQADLVGIGTPSPPHPRARGEDLEGIGA